MRLGEGSTDLSPSLFCIRDIFTSFNGNEVNTHMKFIKNHWKGLTFGLIATIVTGIFALVFSRK